MVTKTPYGTVSEITYNAINYLSNRERINPDQITFLEGHAIGSAHGNKPIFLPVIISQSNRESQLRHRGLLLGEVYYPHENLATVVLAKYAEHKISGKGFGLYAPNQSENILRQYHVSNAEEIFASNHDDSDSQKIEWLLNAALVPHSNSYIIELQRYRRTPEWNGHLIFNETSFEHFNRTPRHPKGNKFDIKMFMRHPPALPEEYLKKYF